MEKNQQEVQATEPKVKKPRAKKPKDIIIHSPVAPDVQITMASELADDEQIERELMGEVLPHFIYEFTQNGKPVRGLSKNGVNEVVRRLNRDSKSGVKIRINPQYLRIERDVEYNGEKGVEVSVYAENLVDGNSAWGIKFEAYKKAGRNGAYNNEFAIEKALTKAERNAKRKLIPEVLATKMISRMIEKGEGVKQIQAPTATATIARPAQPKKSTPEEMQQLVVNAVEKEQSVDKLIDLAEKLKTSPLYNSSFKEAMLKAISNKVDALTNE